MPKATLIDMGSNDFQKKCILGHPNDQSCPLHLEDYDIVTSWQGKTFHIYRLCEGVTGGFFPCCEEEQDVEQTIQ